MFTIYGVAMMVNSKQYYVGYGLLSKTNYLVVIYMSLLPIYAFYVFAKRGLLTEKTMKYMAFVFLALAISNFMSNQARLVQLAIENKTFAEEFTNNSGYAFVGLLPVIVLFYKKPMLQYLFLAICAYYIVLSMKRGAMLSGGLCIIWFLANNMKGASNKRRWFVVLASMSVAVMVYYFVRYMMETSAYFQLRVVQTESGDSSGRDVLYSEIFQSFINQDSPFHLLFGNGANSILLLLGQYAHNDWLSLAIEQGLVGILIYIIYWIALYKVWRRTQHHPQAFMSIGMFLIIYFLISFFSMSFNGVPRSSAMVLGYYLATGFESLGSKNIKTISISEQSV